MRKPAALAGAVVAVVFAAGAVFGAAPEKIVIKELQKTKPPVVFAHKAHGDKVASCQACHHKDEAGKEQRCSAASCHGAKPQGKKPELKEAFHKQCKGCHQKEKKGPVKCDECHKKK